MRQKIQLGLGNLIKVGDLPLICLAELIQPDINIFGNQNQTWHPVTVAAEGDSICGTAGEGFQVIHGDRRRARTNEGKFVLFFQNIQGGKQAIKILAQKGSPVVANILQLPRQGLRHVLRRAQEQVEQGQVFRAKSGLLIEVILQTAEYMQVVAVFSQQRAVEEFGVLSQSRVLVGDP